MTDALESSYTCDQCGKTIPAVETKSLWHEGRMIGIIETYTHECVDGKTMHPFAMLPFPDSRERLWQVIEDNLDLEPNDEQQ